MVAMGMGMVAMEMGDSCYGNLVTVAMVTLVTVAIVTW